MDFPATHRRAAKHRKFYKDLTEQLEAAVRVDVRYNTLNHTKTTRAERNIMVGYEKPGFDLVTYMKDGVKHGLAVPWRPKGSDFLWETFWKLSRIRVDDAVLQPDALLAWFKLHGVGVSALEMGVLSAMDAAYVSQLAEEKRYNEANKPEGNLGR